MDGSDEFKSIKCSRCGIYSTIHADKPINDSYCECGGKHEYVEGFQPYLTNDCSSTKFKKEDLIVEYKKNYDNYLKLGEILKKCLDNSIKDHVEKYRLKCRIKDFKDFYEKIGRNSYVDPFNQIEDIYGLRIICYYSSDLQTISEIIKNEFEILKSVNKSDLLHSGEFGYRSIHFIVKIKKDKLKQSKYQNLKNLKAEIQVRTLLMDAHASIEHHLIYKKGCYMPSIFKHRLSTLSAILETVDKQFVELREEVEEYNFDLALLEKSDVYKNEELNIHSLQDFLDRNFSDREKIPIKTYELFDNLKRYNDNNNDKITLRTLLKLNWKVADFDDLERKYFAHREGDYRWHQSECLNQILWLAHPGFKSYFSA